MNKKIAAIDVAKSELVIYSEGKYTTIANEMIAIRDFFARYKNKHITLG